MEKIKIGKIVNAVALRGEVKVYHYSDYKERFEELDKILVERRGKYEEYEIEGVRYQKEMVILKLKGINDRNEAEALKERDLYITEEDLRELPEDTFYVKDLIGCRVINECFAEFRTGYLSNRTQKWQRGTDSGCRRVCQGSQYRGKVCENPPDSGLYRRRGSKGRIE